jgi:multisubunit Na+/H+ antiporter MnhG subunit
VTARQLALDVLVGLGVAAELVCCVGLLTMRSALDRLHYANAATTVGPLLVAAAIVVREGIGSAQALNALLVMLVLLVAGPAVTSATARALRLRDRGSLASMEAERERGS